jgi:glucose-1-phosphate thymidylyltransferase
MSGQIHKVVIPARGLGKRMRQGDERAQLSGKQSATADSGVKAMIPFRRPFLDYVLSGLADAGYERACLVIGPEHGMVREYYEKTAPPRRMRVSFAIQAEPRGSADALLAAEAFIGSDEFLVQNSDNYYPISALRDLRCLGEPGTALFDAESLTHKGNIPPERIASYALCKIAGDRYLASVAEKPSESTVAKLGHDALVSMNVWRFSPAIFEACRRAPLSSRGEQELPVAVQYGISKLGMRLKVIRSQEGVLDLSYRGDVASVAERLDAIDPQP